MVNPWSPETVDLGVAGNRVAGNVLSLSVAVTAAGFLGTGLGTLETLCQEQLVTDQAKKSPLSSILPAELAPSHSLPSPPLPIIVIHGSFEIRGWNFREHSSCLHSHSSKQSFCLAQEHLGGSGAPFIGHLEGKASREDLAWQKYLWPQSAVTYQELRFLVELFYLGVRRLLSNPTCSSSSLLLPVGSARCQRS